MGAIAARGDQNVRLFGRGLPGKLHQVLGITTLLYLRLHAQTVEPFQRSQKSFAAFASAGGRVVEDDNSHVARSSRLLNRIVRLSKMRGCRSSGRAFGSELAQQISLGASGFN